MRQVMFIEIGQGVDLQGEDATKATIRAVRNAIGRNYMPGMRRLIEAGKGPMLVHVRVGAPPEAGQVDIDAVRATLPYGEITIEQVPGGMLVPDGMGEGGRICIVDVVIEVGVTG
jgi:uncharacterized protein (TIGR02058 family)